MSNSSNAYDLKLHTWLILFDDTNEFGGSRTCVMGVHSGVIYRYIYVQSGHHGTTSTVSMVFVPGETLENIFEKQAGLK